MKHRSPFALGSLACACLVTCGAATAAEETPKELTNSIHMQFVLIPAGEFVMGSPEAEPERTKPEGPQHTVKITRPFYLGRHEVTVGQFRQFVDDTKYVTDAERSGGTRVWTGEKIERLARVNWKQPFFPQTDEHPVVSVSWNDAKAFCEWLSKKEGVDYRLPTEAEWEYACRAGTKSASWWGDEAAGAEGRCNCADAAAKKKNPDWDCARWDDEYVWTSPAGSFKPNAFGLCDMAGNTWEWCADWMAPYTDKDQSDPTGPAAGKDRVLRGGAWNSVPSELRSAYRHANIPTTRYDVTGFRVARTIKAETAGVGGQR